VSVSYKYPSKWLLEIINLEYPEKVFWKQIKRDPELEDPSYQGMSLFHAILLFLDK
jgi:hypothetical protein